MKLTRFWKRENTSKVQTRQRSQAVVRTTTAAEPDFVREKHQKLVLRESKLCLTVPQQAVDTLHISTKRFIEWQPRKQELHGNLLMSETTHTTRIEDLSHNNQYVAIIPSSHVDDYEIAPTKDNGISAICEWNDTGLRIRIPLPRSTKKKKHRRRGAR
ncbi:hypothetical protein CSB45_09420 [candidate division KSB3 bacterium]|uniref:Uncharacterized protein n=1 Tax=candidate division KSB3 bacterium TaxID=2044937 RepID=A0A2G6E484_9BACT|nr:MAG: hypothetical protein CSB45_09420 [candidate division KSB3 bacterium]PIE29456.1 MAG: hypothetical protein CSA57_08655 [candidate division KSB3 bacterium]